MPIFVLNKLHSVYFPNTHTMNRKREKPYHSRHLPYSFPKRRRPLPPPSPDAAEQPDNSTSSVRSPTTVVVIGLPPDCSVLDLKSRFEIYGSISRTRMDPSGVAHITFRSNDSAQSAVDASLDTSFGITLHSKRIQVIWASDPVPHQGEGDGHKDGSLSSKLLRGEVPLRRHGRENRLGSAIVSPKTDNKKTDDHRSCLDVPFKGREIVAYDDIL